MIQIRFAHKYLLLKKIWKKKIAPFYEKHKLSILM